MKKQKELRVYLINVDELDIPKSFYNMTDEEIIENCELSGLIYSIDGFETACNRQEIHLDSYFIKFLYV